LNSHRPAFTLIEILVSVLILSVSIVFVLKIHSQNREQILYVTDRNKHVLEDSLFLGKNILKYHKTDKNAYDLVREEVPIRKDKSRKILKKIKRSIYIPEQIRIVPDTAKETPAARVNEVLLKGDFSSSYFDFAIDTL